MTKEERNKYLAVWRERNREKIRRQHRAWYASHKHEEKLRDEKKRYFKSWLERNRERRNEWVREYRRKNPEVTAIRKKRWNVLNLDKYREMRRRELENPRARVALYMRTRLRMALKAQKAMKRGTLVQMLGINIPELMRYLETKFKHGMTWDNYGKWHIDHIRPLASFDLMDIEQQKIAMHYTNLQPLWAAENMKKSAKYEIGREHEDLASRTLRAA